MTYHAAVRAVKALEMDVEDGLGFTFSCADYPAWIRNMNGWPVEDIARALADQRPEGK